MDWVIWGPPLAVVSTSTLLGAILATRMRASVAEAASVEASGRQDDLALGKDEVLEALASLEGDREALPQEEYEHQRSELIARGASALRAMEEEESPSSTPDSALDAAFAEVQAARAAGREPDAAALKAVQQAVGAAPKAAASNAQARGFAYAVGLFVLVGVLLGVVSQIDATPRGAGGSMTGNGAGQEAPEAGAAPVLAPRLQAEQALHLKTLESDPTNLDALNGMTRVSLASGDLPGALRYSQQAEATDPTDAMVRVYKGVLASAIGRRDRAYELIDEVIAEQPELVDAHIYKGLVALSGRDSSVAVDSLEKALALQDPPDPNLQQALTQAKAMQQMGITPTSSPPGPMGAASSGPRELLVSGTIELPEEYAGAVPISRATFVYLRVPERPGPPVASVKLTAGPFPMTFEVTTANILPMAGVAPSELPETLEIGARLDLDGDAFSKQDDEPQVKMTASRGAKDVILSLSAELHP